MESSTLILEAAFLAILLFVSLFHVEIIRCIRSLKKPNLDQLYDSDDLSTSCPHSLRERIQSMELPAEVELSNNDSQTLPKNPLRPLEEEETVTIEDSLSATSLPSHHPALNVSRGVQHRLSLRRSSVRQDVKLRGSMLRGSRA